MLRIATEFQTKSAFLHRFRCYLLLFRLNFNTLISRIATCLETPHSLPVTSLYCKSLKYRYSTVSIAKRSRYPARNQGVAGSILGEYIYFYFDFFACFLSLQVSRAVANKIKHNHSPVVIVSLDPRHD